MKVFLTLPSLLFLLLPIQPQQIESKSQPTHYALKMTYQKYGEAAPLFVLLADNGGHPTGGFSRLNPDSFMRTAVPENERVSSIEGSVELVGGKWLVNFSVVIGPLRDQEPQRIATYQLDFGETVVVSELSKFQIEPLSVSIVKISELAAVKPVVINDTTSIEVTRVEITQVPFSYKIILKNLSNKPVRALQVESLGRTGSTSLGTPEGSFGRALIEAQGTYQTQSLSTSNFRKIAANEYEPSQSERIRVSSVLFTDWSYEGDPFLAAGVTASTIGSRLQIKQALNLIDSALTNPGSNPQDLQASAGLLKNRVNSADLIELKEKFPTLNSPDVNLVSFGIQGSRNVKADFISDLQQLEAKAASSEGVDFQAWLRTEKTKYEQWLSGLQ